MADNSLVSIESNGYANPRYQLEPTGSVGTEVDMGWFVFGLIIVAIATLAGLWLSVRRPHDGAQQASKTGGPRVTTRFKQMPGMRNMSGEQTAPSLVPAHRGDQTPPSRSTREVAQFSGLRWHGVGTTISFDTIKLRLKDPLAYFTDCRCGLPCQEPAAIDLGLAVSPHQHVPTERELPYWPRYDGLTAAQRSHYLRWLSQGRQEMPAELGYVFLFIYGLERRALVDGTDQTIVFDEVVRLRGVVGNSEYASSRSFDSYTSSFLWFLVARDPSAFLSQRVRQLMEATAMYTEEHQAAALRWFTATSTPLPDWAAFQIAGSLPQSQRSVVVQRVPEELRKLFCRRYREQHGEGLTLGVSKRNRLYAYRPASAAMPHMEFAAPNPLGLQKQYAPLSDIWNQCLQELRKLSSVVAKQGQEELTVAAWEAMPPELRAAVDHPLTDNFCRLVNTAADDDGHSVIFANQLAGIFGFLVQEKYTPTQSRKICDRAGQIGYCLEPDSRLTGKAYRGDERVAAFLRATEQEPDAARYNGAATMLRIGIAVAAADGEIHDLELAVLSQQIQAAFHLNDGEMRRLEALRALMLSQQVDPSALRVLVRGLAPQQREAVAKLVLAIVAADGIITPDELKAVRLCYTQLGFDRDRIEQTFRSLQAVDADEPVTVASAQPGGDGGEEIPQPPTQPAVGGGLKLDRAAIAAIMMDTQEVAKMLAAAMNAEEGAVEITEERDASVSALPPIAPIDATPMAIAPPAVLNVAAAPAVVETADATLPQRYATFYQILMTKGEWMVKDAEAIARQHGHMLSGAIETINDWAFERYGNPLFVEEGDRLVVDKQIMN